MYVPELCISECPFLHPEELKTWFYCFPGLPIRLLSFRLSMHLQGTLPILPDKPFPKDCPL